MADMRNSRGAQRFVGFFIVLFGMLIGWAEKLQSHDYENQ